MSLVKSTEGKDLDYIWFAKCEGFVFLNNDCQLLLNYLQSIGDTCFFQQFFIISFSGATPKIWFKKKKKKAGSSVN